MDVSTSGPFADPISTRKRLSESPSAKFWENGRLTKQLASLNKALVEANSDDGATGLPQDARGISRTKVGETQALLSDHTQTQRANEQDTTQGAE